MLQSFEPMAIARAEIGFFFFSSRRRHTRLQGDWSSDVCSSDLDAARDGGATAVAIACDVTDEKSCRAAVDEAAAHLGGIDALVYTPGIGPLADRKSVV